MKTLLKRFLLIAFCITPIVVLINHSFTSKATDKPDFQNKSSKTASKSDKKIEDPEITLTFSGDTMFDWQLRPVIEKNGADYPFQHVKEEITKADISFVNLESAFTTKEKKAPGQLFWIKSDPSTLKAIKNTGYDIVNIGNNHTLDYGQNGLLDTISHVEKLKFPYIGAGKNAKDAYTAREMTVKGKNSNSFHSSDLCLILLG